MQNQVICVNVDDNLKQEVEKIFQDLGLSTSEAICLFYEQVSQHKGLPFAIDVPNTETAQAIEDARAKKLTPIAASEIGTLFNA
jgi:DNA-damage-inducible protein J